MAGKRSFARFVRPDGEGLYDVIDGPNGVDAIRPNQIFAVSLPHSALSAEEQGPVWGWLLGPFSLAVHRVDGDPEAAEALLQRMRDALEDQAVGTIGEIFDGDPPHHPRGAPAQAWSVACTLDAWRMLRQAKITDPEGTTHAATQ